MRWMSMLRKLNTSAFFFCLCLWGSFLYAQQPPDELSCQKKFELDNHILTSNVPLRFLPVVRRTGDPISELANNLRCRVHFEREDTAIFLHVGWASPGISGGCECSPSDTLLLKLVDQQTIHLRSDSSTIKEIPGAGFTDFKFRFPITKTQYTLLLNTNVSGIAFSCSRALLRESTLKLELIPRYPNVFSIQSSCIK